MPSLITDILSTKPCLIDKRSTYCRISNVFDTYILLYSTAIMFACLVKLNCVVLLLVAKKDKKIKNKNIITVLLTLFSQLPFLCGLPFLERRASQAAHFIVGRSGKHLFLTDKDDGRPPLLLRMVNDSDDLKFMLVLISRKSLIFI